MQLYSSAHSAIRVSRDTRARGGGLLATSLYHPRIYTHVSLKGAGSDAMMDSIVCPALSAVYSDPC